ncbi:CheR family methyltransferase [Chitinivibrio alkaliphilus]|uniref:protein-glutamate O-methyltransferase n=1 Tax=Chitinivibrio alkaliphilus ACht1 TaxID=1313304 RepID=U7DBM7_9BACT|nr:protein-glutamate O-methyltransferase CheR [Chitinivibrio alkaliphilus]ERP31825.1 chemotaxis protein methyltransferase CheR [Chitinivibrio alkaliphilus ACht1]
MNLSTAQFSLIRDILHEKSGILISPDKQYLPEQRLPHLLRERNYQSLTSFLDDLKKCTDLQDDFINHMTTNETSFFRDRPIFNLLKTHLIPQLCAQKEHVRIWSAATATGQEAYSLAMTISELTAGHKNISIWGSDISSRAIEVARTGVYSAFEVRRGTTQEERTHYFTAHGNTYSVKAPYKSMVQFSVENILTDSLPHGTIDLLLCRNVAIYFDRPSQEVLYQRLHNALSESGILIIGGTESIRSGEKYFQRNKWGSLLYYTKKGGDTPSR